MPAYTPPIMQSQPMMPIEEIVRTLEGQSSAMDVRPVKPGGDEGIDPREEIKRAVKRRVKRQDPQNMLSDTQNLDYQNVLQYLNRPAPEYKLEPKGYDQLSPRDQGRFLLDLGTSIYDNSTGNSFFGALGRGTKQFLDSRDAKEAAMRDRAEALKDKSNKNLTTALDYRNKDRAYNLDREQMDLARDTLGLSRWKAEQALKAKLSGGLNPDDPASVSELKYLMSLGFSPQEAVNFKYAREKGDPVQKTVGNYLANRGRGMLPLEEEEARSATDLIKKLMGGVSDYGTGQGRKSSSRLDGLLQKANRPELTERVDMLRSQGARDEELLDYLLSQGLLSDDE